MFLLFKSPKSVICYSDNPNRLRSMVCHKGEEQSRPARTGRREDKYCLGEPDWLGEVTLNWALNTWKHLYLGATDSGRTFLLKEMLQARLARGKHIPSIYLESLVCVIWRVWDMLGHVVKRALKARWRPWASLRKPWGYTADWDKWSSVLYCVFSRVILRSQT